MCSHTQAADLPELGEVTVKSTGLKAKSAVSTASESLPATVTVIDQEEIRRTNYKDFTDLLRKVPGVNAYSFGQNDIGSPIKMRGFVGTGAHGSDVAIYVDGVPQNFPSAAQGGPGMSDMSWLTPEMIERIEVIKGPFSALYGDQNRAGAINIITCSEGPSSTSVTTGRFDNARLNGVLSRQSDENKVFAVAELYHNGGYRDNSQLDRGNAFAKLTIPLHGARVAVRGNYYKADFSNPGYLRYSDLTDGSVSPSARDPYSLPLFGKAERYALALNYDNVTEAGWHANAYAEHYNKTRVQPGASYAATGAVTPTTLWTYQHDDRDVFGGRAVYNFMWGDQAQLSIGMETRLDRGQDSNQRYNNSAPTGLYNSYWDLDLLTYGLFAQGSVKVADSLKLVGGIRNDQFNYDIKNRKRPDNSVHYNGSVTTPRLGLVFTASPNLTLYTNYGEGFRSPAERELSPQGAGALALGSGAGTTLPSGLKPPKLKSADLGFNARIGSQWLLNGAIYHTTNQKEIREEPSGSGIFVAAGDTTRDGLEADINYLPNANWRWYASYGFVRARINNPLNAGQNLIGGLPRELVTAGVEHTHPCGAGTLLVNVNFQYVDKAPYYVGTSATPLYSRSYVRYDLRVGYELGKTRYTAFMTLQPREFASEQAGANVDPRPKVDGGVNVTYTF